jgi:single-strand DNA-binding protein
VPKSTNQHVSITGFAGSAPTLRSTQSGRSVAGFSVATDEGYKSGEQWVDKTEWHKLVVWGEDADRVAAEVNKGDLVHVEGKLQTRKWTDEQGIDHYSTEIVARVCRRMYYEKKGQGQYAPAHSDDDFRGPGQAQPAPALDDYDIGDLGPPMDLDDTFPLSPGV